MSQVVELLVFTALAILLLVFLTRSGCIREAVTLMVSAPGYLVPGTMIATGTIMFASRRMNANIHENPWGSPFGLPSLPFNFFLLTMAGLAIAGQIGLLEASTARLRPGSAAFMRGIRRHGGTLIIGKLLLSLMIYLLMEFFRPRSFGTVIYIAPSILLAPLIGMASQHPGRPLQALKSTLCFAQEHMSAIARIVTRQALFLFGLFYIYARVIDNSHSLVFLGHSNSVLSYNPYPYVMMHKIPFCTLTMVTLSAFASSVFITTHWLGVRDGYSAEREDEAG